MKRAVLGIIALSALGLSGMASAQGLYCTGTVSATATSLSGSMNNRYNTAATTYSTYIVGYGYANSTVYFAGRDDAGDNFNCYVPTTSALHAAATDIKNNLKNGSYLYVYKSTTSNECTGVYLQNHSCRMD